MTARQIPESDHRQRISKIAEQARGPSWLGHVLVLMAQRTDAIPPLPDDRSELPEFIYRH